MAKDKCIRPVLLHRRARVTHPNSQRRIDMWCVLITPLQPVSLHTTPTKLAATPDEPGRWRGLEVTDPLSSRSSIGLVADGTVSLQMLGRMSQPVTSKCRWKGRIVHLRQIVRLDGHFERTHDICMHCNFEAGEHERGVAERGFEKSRVYCIIITPDARQKISNCHRQDMFGRKLVNSTSTCNGETDVRNDD